MGLNNNDQGGCYYGHIPVDDVKPARTLGEDIIKDMNDSLQQVLREMEDRIKRHITECKREIIREMLILHESTNQKEDEHGSRSDKANKKRSDKQSSGARK